MPLKRISQKIAPHKAVVKNFGYLSVLQVFNMALPLITYPYLIRVLGKETYGLITYAQAIIAYLVILISYGFNISAVKEVSIHRENPKKLNEIFSSVMSIKFAILLVLIAVLAVVLYFIPKTQNVKTLFYLSMWQCFYDFLIPLWYFQGIEKMKYITFVTLVSRIVFLALIFVLIHQPNDYLYVPIINGLGVLASGGIALYIILLKHKIRFILQKFDTLKFYFFESTPVFLSNLSVQLYVNTNKVIVGSFLGMQDVAYYDLAEKITSMLKIPQSILSQTLFPKIAKERNPDFVRKMFKWVLLLNIGLFAGTLIFSKLIISVLGGEDMLKATVVLNILSITVPVIAVSNVWGIQLLLPFGYNKSFSKVIILSGAFYALLVLATWSLFGFSLLNISCLTVATEVFVSTLMYYYCKKQNLWK